MNKLLKSETTPIQLSIVVPCFNEEDVLHETTRRLKFILDGMQIDGLISTNSAIVYIDDGSTDQTWPIIQNIANSQSQICGIKLTRNRGHQNALLCGLLNSPGDAIISIDADLQDDLSVIPSMVKFFIDGFDIVYGVRKCRDTDTFFKRFTAESYYKFMSVLKVDIIFNHADYRLLSRRAIISLADYKEVNIFLRGLIPLLGYKCKTVEYDRSVRFAGESKYPLRKMLSFAWQGVTSFSTAPLSLITGIGIILSLSSIALGIWGLLISIISNRAVPGWASTVVPMYFLGGIQLLCLGVIGEYISKIYIECKKRPRFNIEQYDGNAIIEHFNTLVRTKSNK